ncbi:MAG: aminopeptidase P family protein [Verrucomicrobia bacterium]|nr:aminopeptidase P family protein [Verrucomicrobiota bacterium]
MANTVHQARLRRLFRKLDGVADAVLMEGDESLLRWLTGVREGMAIATKKGVTMVAHPMFAEACGESGWPVVVFSKKEKASVTIRRVLDGAKKVGLRFGPVGHAQFLHTKKELRGCTLVDISAHVDEVQRSRDAAELKDQRKACLIAARAAKAVPTMCDEGMTEIDLLAEIIFHMAGQGAEGHGMVAFGTHTSYPHVITSGRRLKKGDYVMVDFGCNVGGVGSDITRTFVFGQASAKQNAVYNEVWKACQLSFDLIEKKKDVRAINTAINELFDKDGYGPFIHSVGHGLGIFGGAFHIVPGAVVTIEPGIYIPGFGGVRIEDDIVITKPGKYELLTGASPRSKLIEI